MPGMRYSCTSPGAVQGGVNKNPQRHWRVFGVGKSLARDALSLHIAMRRSSRLTAHLPVLVHLESVQDVAER